MQLPRFVGMVDLGIATVIVVLVVLPAREMYASAVIKGDESQQFGLSLAEARTIARPGDGLAVEEFTRRLDEANQKDWAIDEAVAAAERAKDSPTRWRALLAASTAFVDRLDVTEGLSYADMALNACDAARDKGDAAACPSWEQIRMQLYHDNLKAGVDSGIDPRRDPRGFRKAGESALRQIRLTTHDKERASGSGSAGSAQPDPAGSAAHPGP
jgi:hypothetical protein